jgi:hypothetical protein
VYNFSRVTATQIIAVFTNSLSSLPLTNPPSRDPSERDMDTVVSWAEVYETQHPIPNVQRSPGVSSNSMEVLGTLFAGLSVLIGSLALVVGFLQLLKCQRRRRAWRSNSVHELEAILPEVTTTPIVDRLSSLVR